jgi:antitoxin ParD1/3/4
MNISLTPDLDNWVIEQIKTGSYLSATELICEAVRLLQNRDVISLNQKVNSTEEKLWLLRAKLQAGENSPIVKDFNAEHFISGLHRKYAQ